MSKKGRAVSFLWGVLFGVALLFGGYYLGQRVFKRNPLVRAVTPMDKFKATLQLIDENYVDTVDTDVLIADLIPTLVNQLDPHSTYLTAEERRSEKERVEGFFYGIGITFNTIKDTAIVISAIPNGPSDIAGIKAGDRIITIDGDEVTGSEFPADSIRSLLRGEEGTIVEIGVKPYDSAELMSVQVKRGVVATPSVDAAFMVNDSLGYVRLSSFTMATYDEFMQAVAKLRANGMKGLVLDLRDNPGGLLQSALMIANEFLPRQSLVIYQEGAHFPRQDVLSDGTGTLIGFPLYVLINELSASSSEVISGSIQDNDAGIVIGRRSFGKGLVQKPFEYYDGSSVHLTIARYHTASGRSIQRGYKLGGDTEYSHDWYERFLGGEMFYQDSIKIDKSLVYETKGGRPVYAGGGIMPDIFVPRDTVGITSYYAEVLNKGVLHQFAFEYSDRYRDLLIRLGGVKEVYNFLNNQGLVWQLASYASKKGIPARNYLIYLSQEQLNNVLFPLVIEYIYGSSAGWEARSFKDPTVKRAEELFGAEVTSPYKIPEEHIAIPDSILQVP